MSESLTSALACERETLDVSATSSALPRAALSTASAATPRTCEVVWVLRLMACEVLEEDDEEEKGGAAVARCIVAVWGRVAAAAVFWRAVLTVVRRVDTADERRSASSCARSCLSCSPGSKHGMDAGLHARAPRVLCEGESVRVRVCEW